MPNLTAMLVVAAMIPSAPTQDPRPPDDREAVVSTLRGYHEALARAQPDKVVDLLGTSYFMADERSGQGSERLSAHLFLAGERLKSWPRNYLREVGPHQNQFTTIAVSVRGDAAAVVTRDTGRNRFRAWTDEETSWFLGRINGAWRIVGMVIRDIQLPK